MPETCGTCRSYIPDIDYVCAEYSKHAISTGGARNVVR